MSKLDQELVDEYHSANNTNGGGFLWHVGEDNYKETIAAWYITASSICLLALTRQKRSERYFHMPFSGTIIE